jgi:MFS family permease
VDLHTNHDCSKYKIAGLSSTGQADLNANIASTLQAGCFVGCFVASWMADKWGRKIALQVAGLVTILGCVFQAVALGHIEVMYIGRLIAGLGVGAASMVVPLYISENSPRAIRGGLTGLYQLFIATGTCLAFWVNYGSLLHLSGSAKVYIVPLALQALPAVLLVGCMALNKESPRFLAKQDRWEEANNVLARMRNLPVSHEYVQAEIKDIADQLEHERMLIAGASVKDLLREMFTIPGNRKRALISIGLMICQQMTGTNAINYYAPQIFKALGLEGNEVKLFATGIYGITKVIQFNFLDMFSANSIRWWDVFAS